MNFFETVELDPANPAEAAHRASNALARTKVVWMRPSVAPDNLRSFYDSLVEGIGNPISIGEDFTQGGVQTGERWLEIRYDAAIPDMAAFRHSKNAQPLHTDESYITDPADIMLFYCVNRAPVGGATIFIDSDALLAALTAENPALLERLTTTPVRYEKGGEHRTLPIISTDHDGDTRFNYNYYCVDPSQNQPAIDLNQDFFDFLEAKREDRALITEVALDPGESVAWWDDRVLHGRDAFEANATNDRFIWKAGIRFNDARVLT